MTSVRDNYNAMFDLAQILHKIYNYHLIHNTYDIISTSLGNHIMRQIWSQIAD